MEMPEPMLRRRQVMECTGMTNSGLYREIKEGRFPRPKRITKNTVAWPASVVKAWQDGLTESDAKGGPGRGHKGAA
ncbi:helix-turn-helix transcriptional regulator [Shimia thalassica]|uniref:helix-turn-helix transcriptional regulator n=1 Tax=Shimia thalassica TaxID=1715693 RepID=UPI002733A7BD|nr:AlpA family phage regulatory protein [Shimia thalassica]MDP2518732.1 AlpA family phage regulatory protein [Shimia thalassica]